MRPRCRGFTSELPEFKFCKDPTLTVRTRGASGPRGFVPPGTRSCLTLWTPPKTSTVLKIRTIFESESLGEPSRRRRGSQGPGCSLPLDGSWAPRPAGTGWRARGRPQRGSQSAGGDSGRRLLCPRASAVPSRPRAGAGLSASRSPGTADPDDSSAGPAARRGERSGTSGPAGGGARGRGPRRKGKPPWNRVRRRGCLLRAMAPPALPRLLSAGERRAPLPGPAASPPGDLGAGGGTAGRAPRARSLHRCRPRAAPAARPRSDGRGAGPAKPQDAGKHRGARRQRARGRPR